MSNDINELKAKAEQGFYWGVFEHIHRLEPQFAQRGIGFRPELEAYFWLDNLKKAYETSATKGGFTDFYKQDKLISGPWEIIQGMFNDFVKPHLDTHGKVKKDAAIDAETAAALREMIREVKGLIFDLAEQGDLLEATSAQLLLSEKHKTAVRKNPNQPCSACDGLTCVSRVTPAQVAVGAGA